MARLADEGADVDANRAEVVSCRTFREVFQRVEVGAAAMGLLPIENSLTGSIHEVYDLLLEFPLSIVGEVFQPIEHKLLGLPGASLEHIKHVYSHPQALWQCERFLSALSAKQHAFYDTAGAAKWVAEQRNPHYAAIAGPLAARLYRLEVLCERIADYEHNITRFLLVAPASFHLAAQTRAQDQGAAQNWKTSLVIELSHVPGALYRALGIFAAHRLNLTKLESRPLRTEPWRYRFYLDFEGRVSDPAAQRALQQLEACVQGVKVLGSYPQGRGEPS
jgi:prephenate dehydratase